MMKTKWDRTAINSRTDRTNLRVQVQLEWLKSIENDIAQNGRLARQECTVCFYTNNICGQGFTNYDCAICEVQQQWHNTCVPMLCKPCAVKYQVCKNCGADINLDQKL